MIIKIFLQQNAKFLKPVDLNIRYFAAQIHHFTWNPNQNYTFASVVASRRHMHKVKPAHYLMIYMQYLFDSHKTMEMNHNGKLTLKLFFVLLFTMIKMFSNTSFLSVVLKIVL